MQTCSTEYLSSDEFIAVLNETLSQNKAFKFIPTGTSMLPLLNGSTDTVTLCKKADRLNKYDVVLYRRNDNVLILHRIIRCNKDNTFVISGDGQYHFDYNIKYDDIIAVMSSFTHKGRTVETSDFLYNIYFRIMLLWKYTRVFISKIYHKIFG